MSTQVITNPDGSIATIVTSDPTIAVDGLKITVTAADPVYTWTPAPAPAAAPLLVGTSTPVNGAAPSWAPADGVARVYTPAGKGCYTWTSAPMIAAMAHKPKCIILSMKDAPTQAILGPVLDGIPAGIILRLVFHHEPEQGPSAGDPSPAQYAADWAAGAAIVKAHPKRKQIILVQVLTQYAELHGKGPWQTWITGDADEVGIDCYTDAVSTTDYPAAVPEFALLLAVMAATGKPGCVPEYGAKRVASDTDGSKCAAMITSHVTYLRQQPGVRAIVWWDSSPFALEARPAEEAAWKAAVAGSR